MNMRAWTSWAVGALLGAAAMGGAVNAQPASPADKPVAKAKADYMEVPLSGEFGKEILAGGVRKALARAKAEGVQHIVFVLDSGGGIVADAKGISEVMREFDGSFKYHAVIKKAFSASLWVLVGCDDWFCVPGAASGAAVVFKLKNDTGAVEVDAKLNGAVAATLASMAAEKGHPADAIKAMVLMEAKLYLNPGPSVPGGSRLSATQAPGGVEVDGEATVLSATTDQMVEWGLAKAIGTGDASEQVGKAIGAASWKSQGNGGAAAMKAAATAYAAAHAEREKAYQQYTSAVKTMVDGVKAFTSAGADADKVDPNSIHVYEDDKGRKSKTDLNRLESAMDQKMDKLSAAVEAAKGVATGQANAKRAAASYETAHKKLVEAAGLKADSVARQPVEMPEIPKDFQLDAQQRAKELGYWQQQKISRIGHR